ncbi:LysM peptidoglycan-binding domain-containing protein [Thalassotalea euphylliae]|uniref:LysM peptidoglycan-binding domain-containing protein n=1 Tax=Thalassotalea euphylliae TaxID=1655234 RepID=UPI00364552F1
MKYLPLSISASLFLFGCQTLDVAKTSQESPLVNENVASPIEINQALLVDETIDVIHPVADVDIELSQGDVHVSEDIWQHIRSGLTFDVPENKRVLNQRNWYARHPSYMDRVAKRAEPFLHYIVQELEANDMPMEMALLPIVESAFDPFAYSHGRASGMWQFVPGTGKRFGMKQNWWYDGRRDVIASTEGAIKYLKYLHKYFDGDWLHALAAYNSGEGRVKRAIRNNARKNKPTDFWSLDLPKETRAYVPKLLALADLVKRPEDFGLKLYEIDNAQVISKVDVKSQLDLAKAARLADLSLAEFQRLNPGFNRWATDPDGPHNLLIPTAKVESFKEKLSKLSEKERLSWQRYQIKSGDSLIRIAKKFHTTPELIRKVNNINGNNIRAGKHLLIPVAAQALDDYILSQDQRLTQTQQRKRNGVKLEHKVKSGDTLWDISRKYNVSTRSIAKWNGMAPRDYIKPGQTLVIWQKVGLKQAPGKPAAQAVMRNITYKVRRGDSFARIADKFNVKISDIEKWNNLSRKNYLQPGQMLKLSVDVTNNI